MFEFLSSKKQVLMAILIVVKLLEEHPFEV
jgi:hypothetical protein